MELDEESAVVDYQNALKQTTDKNACKSNQTNGNDCTLVNVNLQTTTFPADPEAGLDGHGGESNANKTTATGNHLNVCPVIASNCNKSCFGRLYDFSSKFLPLASFATCGSRNHGRTETSSRLNTLSTCTTIACIILLCIYIVRSQATDLSSSGPQNYNTNTINQKHYRSLQIPIPTVFDHPESYAWNSIEKLLESKYDKNRLHIHVVEHGNTKRVIDPTVHFETHANTLKISGRPNFCTESDTNAPVNVTASHVTHLHLSEMDDCHHYLKLIFTEWRFPKVHHLKLHKMLIREQEFNGLSKFIDRHNQTLHKVEIDECFLCPSPICDVGLINFPNHDFQITMTRRRESPAWI